MSTCTNNVSKHSETELIGTGGSVVTEVYQFNSLIQEHPKMCLWDLHNIFRKKNLPACYYGFIDREKFIFAFIEQTNKI